MQTRMELCDFELWLLARVGEKTSGATVRYVRKWLKSADISDSMSLMRYVAKERKRGTSNASVNKIIQSVKRFCEFKKFTHIEIPKQLTEHARVRKTFSDHEIEQFLAGSSLPHWTDFFTVLAFTGCRPGELLHLDSDSIDTLTRTLTLMDTKTHKDRIIPLSDRAFDALSRQLSTEKLFCFSHTSMLKEFHKRCKKLGFVGRVPYSFRHSLATRLLDEDQNLFAVQDILGHSSAKTTAIYYHSNLKKLRSVIDSDTLNRLNMKPKLVIEKLVLLVKSFFKNDDRFDVKIEQSDNEVVIRVKKKRLTD